MAPNTCSPKVAYCTQKGALNLQRECNARIGYFCAMHSKALCILTMQCLSIPMFNFMICFAAIVHPKRNKTCQGHVALREPEVSLVKVGRLNCGAIFFLAKLHMEQHLFKLPTSALLYCQLQQGHVRGEGEQWNFSLPKARNFRNTLPCVRSPYTSC